MESDDASVVSGTTIHSGNNSPDLLSNVFDKIGGRSFQNTVSAGGDASSPVIPVTRSRFQNVIEEPVYCSPLKKKKVTEEDKWSDNESCLSQSILTNYRQKVYTKTQTWELHGSRCMPDHATKTRNEVDNFHPLSQDSDETRLSSQETSQNDCREKAEKKGKGRGRIKKTKEKKNTEPEDDNLTQTGGSQVLFPDTQSSSSQSLEKQMIQSSQTSSGKSSASGHLRDLDSNLSKEEMVTAFGKIRKIHAQIEKNIKDKDKAKEIRESFEKKLAIVHTTLKNISEKMSNEKVRISFDVKHSVKTVEARDRLREQMKDLTQRQNALKDLLLKQAELTKSLKQSPGDLKEVWSQSSATSNILTNKVNDWMTKNPGTLKEASKANACNSSVSVTNISGQVNAEKNSQSSRAVQQVLKAPVTPRMQSGIPGPVNTQTLNAMKGPTVIHTNKDRPPENSKESTYSVLQVQNASEMSKNQTIQIIYVDPKTPNSKHTGPVLAQGNSISLLSPNQTKATTVKSSQNFKRPSEIMKSPPLFNPDSLLRKNLKSPPMHSIGVTSFKSPPISLPRSAAEDKNISPSTVCSSDVFPVSCKELGRRIQERIASQREAASQQASQGQRSSTLSQEAPTGIMHPLCTKTPQIQAATAYSGNKGDEDDQTKYEKYGGLKFPPLKTLIDLDILFPGENVFTVLHQGRVFSASLTATGNIESKGGEIFTTPMKWLSAVKGGDVVKNFLAYREILYDGHSLKRYVDGEQKTSKERIQALSQREVQKNRETSDHQALPQSETSKELDDEDREMADLLFQCKVQLLDKTDMVPMDDLPENFWSSDFSTVHLSRAFWNGLNDWNNFSGQLTHS